MSVLVVVAGTLAVAGPAAASRPLAACPWVGSSATPQAKAAQVLAQMTVDEKVALVLGTGNGGSFAGEVAGNSRLCLPAFVLHDGPNGVAGFLSNVTQLPAPVAAAATWDTALVQSYGDVEGAEQKAKGVSVALAPMVNIVRDPRFGRAFETYSEDPYLASRMGVANILGIQAQGVMAQVKHLAAYNQETNRNSGADNVIADDRTMHEIYLPAFDAAIHQGGAASVMCSYNYLNGSPACANSYLLNQVLRTEWGFEGFVTSDWGAVGSTADAAEAGLDMQMPSGDAAELKSAVQSGRVPTSRLNDMVRHILIEMFRFGLVDNPPTPNPDAPAATPAHAAVATQAAQEGAVLLKNDGGALPLDPSRQRSIAVIGQPANDSLLTTDGLGNPVSTPAGVISPLNAIKSRAGSGVTVTYTPGPSVDSGLTAVPSSALTPASGTGHGLSGKFYTGTSPAGTPVLSRVDGGLSFSWGGSAPGAGVPATGWSASWSGTLTPPATGRYRFSLDSDDGSRLTIGGKVLIDNWHDQAGGAVTATVDLTAGKAVPVKVDYYQGGGDSHLRFGWLPPNAVPDPAAVSAARAADVAVVFVAKTSGEGADTDDIDLSGVQNDLISSVAAANPNTIVVVQSGSAVTMPWLGSVAGVLEDWFPGQAIGPALAAVLFGDVNPSGKLPVTFPQSLADVPANTAARWPGQNDAVQYSEGLDVGYRWYDDQGKTPMFPFGYGLSYTNFRYANLSVGAPDGAGNVAVGFDLTNTGSRAGAEVAQVYVGQPGDAGEPAKNLRGFQRVSLNPGQSKHVTITLDARSFQHWSGGWVTSSGTHQILVGSSSRDVRLTGQVTVGGGGGGGGGGPIVGIAGKCVNAAASTDGSPVQLWDCDGSAGQQWTVGADGTLQAYGKCLDVTGAGTANATPVILWTCHGGSNQVWQPQPNGTLQNPNSSRCLDDPGANTANGTQLIIWDCSGKPNQLWNLPS